MITISLTVGRKVYLKSNYSAFCISNNTFSTVVFFLLKSNKKASLANVLSDVVSVSDLYEYIYNWLRTSSFRLNFHFVADVNIYIPFLFCPAFGSPLSTDLRVFSFFCFKKKLFLVINGPEECESLRLDKECTNDRSRNGSVVKTFIRSSILVHKFSLYSYEWDFDHPSSQTKIEKHFRCSSTWAVQCGFFHVCLGNIHHRSCLSCRFLSSPFSSLPSPRGCNDIFGIVADCCSFLHLVYSLRHNHQPEL